MTNLRWHGPANTDELALLFGCRPAEFDGRKPESKGWSDVRASAQMALSELEKAARIVRICTQRDALFMVAEDATGLIEEALQALASHGRDDIPSAIGEG
jgi:hypothetical protein